MGLRAAEDTGSRFMAFVDGYVSVIGHADRAGPLRLRELYKNLAISQRELDQAASDQQTAKAICGRRCQQEAPTPAPFAGATRPPPVSALEMSFALAAVSCHRP
jgi:hypothetical protein